MTGFEVAVRVCANSDAKVPEGVTPVFTTCGSRGWLVPTVGVADRGCGKAVIYDGASQMGAPDGSDVLTLCVDCSLKLAAGISRDPGAFMAEPRFAEDADFTEEDKTKITELLMGLAEGPGDPDDKDALWTASDTAAAVKAHFAAIPIPEDEQARRMHLIGAVSGLGALMPVLYAAHKAGKWPSHLAETLAELVADTVEAVCVEHGIAPGLASTLMDEGGRAG